MLHAWQANSVSRGDEAIAAAEVLVLRDELESSRRKEAVTAKMTMIDEETARSPTVVVEEATAATAARVASV